MLTSNNLKNSEKSEVAAVSPLTLLTTELQNLRGDVMSLAKAIMALQQRVADAEIIATEVRPQLLTVRAHSESLPQALRQLRRDDVELQKSVRSLEGRLREMEARIQEPPQHS